MEFHTDINRASVRRHAPPGGASSIHLGHDEPVQFKHAAPAINNIWGLERPDEIASKSPAKKPMRQYSNTKNNIFGGSDVHVEENVENKVNFDLNNHNNNMMLKNSIGNVVPPVMTKPIVQHVQQQQPNVSAVSFHKLMQSLFKLDAMNQWGSIVALTYIAAQRAFPNYNDMADNKAYLESIARSFGYIFGKEKNVRVNTISQSPTLTTAGKGVKGLDDFLNYAQLTSPLGNATAEDCANLTVSLFSDYTKRVNLQNIFNDGGFSNVGVSQEIIDKLNSKRLRVSHR